ncbi:ABC transporter ATP-binding protein [Shumkonia mesophila]|uniref:ABC transporter ATP-binding protein n=1 Tax=Shumkonia mesophila TaxID=2838854 RepID=UPI002934EA92|nr:ABC transporter ATP-binding protein [Shumkonia mesophila]
MITLERLTKKFGSILAVDGLSLSVQRGEVLGFLGPNGAGKTTTMRMITGFLSPTGGTAAVGGFDVTKTPIAVRRLIGYLPEGAPLYGDMTPAAFLDFIAGMRGFGGAEKKRRMDWTVETLQLGDVLHRPIDTLSKGYKRRVGLAQAILHDPAVLILDEPTDGLDPNQKHQVRALIRSMARDKAIVISTHILEEVEAVCTRSVVIAGGRIVFDGAPRDLQRRSRRHNAVEIRLAVQSSAALAGEIAALPGVAAVDALDEEGGLATLLVVPHDGRPIIHDLSECIRASGLAIEEMHTERGDLAEVFRQLTIAA